MGVLTPGKTVKQGVYCRMNYIYASMSQAQIKTVGPPGPRIIGLFFIVTGLYGLLYAALREAILSNALGAVAGALAFGFTIHSGYLLLKEDVRGIKRGMLVAALQMVNFNVAGISYVFVTGLHLGFYISRYMAGFSAHFQTVCWVFIGRGDGFYQVGVNLFALGLYFYLRKIRNERKKEGSLDKIAESFKRSNSTPKQQTEIQPKITPEKQKGGGRGERPH
jgi:hypothetical protein